MPTRHPIFMMMEMHLPTQQQQTEKIAKREEDLADQRSQVKKRHRVNARTQAFPGSVALDKVPSFTLRVIVDDELVSNPDANIDPAPDHADMGAAESTAAATHPINKREQQQQQQKKLKASQKAVIYEQKERAAGEEKVNGLKNVVKGLGEEIGE